MELIDREELLKDLKTSAIYHANNSREETLMYRDRNIVREQPTVEAIPKADYEARLKADLVAMLDEISLEIDEMDYASIIDCQKLIREKINALKEPSNDD